MDRTIEARMASNIPRTKYNDVEEEESPQYKNQGARNGYQRQYETNSSGFQIGSGLKVGQPNQNTVGQVKVKQYMPPANRNAVNTTAKDGKTDQDFYVEKAGE